MFIRDGHKIFADIRISAKAIKIKLKNKTGTIDVKGQVTMKMVNLEMVKA
jgi:hypothetical protein